DIRSAAMKDLPHWVKKILENDNLTCGVCDKVVSLKDLFSMGIQKSSMKPYKEVLFVGIVCKACKEMTLFELREMTLIDFAFEILGGQSQVQSRTNKKELDKEINISSRSKKNI
ncbi:hypothetical protein LCGC14_2007800, partial [marine sediment metagenome]